MDTLTKGRPVNHEISSYYDSTVESQLQKFVNGNPRVSAAVQLALSEIGEATTKILDVGCGIGVSSAEFASKKDWLTVHAIDISEASIETARQLFKLPNITFEVGDMQSPPRMAPYDLIVMVDVYEHIPRAEWPRFNQVVNQSLSEKGIAVLTTPSYLHQNFLMDNSPEQLQIIDETVTIDDMIELARALNGAILKFEFKSIWKTNDYLHVVISRQPRYLPVIKDERSKWSNLLGRLKSRIDRESRRNIVRSRLNR